MKSGRFLVFGLIAAGFLGMNAFAEDAAAPAMDPAMQEKMKAYTEMYLTGSREIYQVW